MQQFSIKRKLYVNLYNRHQKKFTELILTLILIHPCTPITRHQICSLCLSLLLMIQTSLCSNRASATGPCHLAQEGSVMGELAGEWSGNLHSWACALGSSVLTELLDLKPAAQPSPKPLCGRVQELPYCDPQTRALGVPFSPAPGVTSPESYTTLCLYL